MVKDYKMNYFVFFMNIFFSGKVVVIIGVVFGIGFECVRILLGVGVKVVLIDCEGEKFNKLVVEFGENVFVLQVDLMQVDQVDNLLQGILQFIGCFDIFYVNVGVYIGGLVVEGDLDVWDCVLYFNINVVFCCVCSVLLYLIV